MQTPRWYEQFEGDCRQLPGSQGEGIDVVRFVLAPLQASIAFLTGMRNGTRKELESAFRRIAQGQPLLCETCNQDVVAIGHSSCCVVLLMFLETVSPANEFDQEQSTMRLFKLERELRKAEKRQNAGSSKARQEIVDIEARIKFEQLSRFDLHHDRDGLQIDGTFPAGAIKASSSAPGE